MSALLVAFVDMDLIAWLLCGHGCTEFWCFMVLGLEFGFGFFVILWIVFMVSLAPRAGLGLCLLQFGGQLVGVLRYCVICMLGGCFGVCQFAGFFGLGVLTWFIWCCALLWCGVLVVCGWLH